MFYSQVAQHERVCECKAIYMHKTWEGKIKNYSYLKERLQFLVPSANSK